jgi:hypothetical protein
MKSKIFLIVIILIGLVSNIFPQQRFRRAVFLSRSVGGFIYQYNGASTDVPNEIAAYNTAHNYTGGDAVSMYKVYPFPYVSDHDNEWFRWHHIFHNDAGYAAEHDSLFNMINGSTYDIIMIKTCFYAASMTDGAGDPTDTLTINELRTVYNYKWHWRYMIRIMEAHPDKFFVIWTNSAANDYEQHDDSVYVDRFATWCKDTLAAGFDVTFGAFPPNVYVFDFFHTLANAGGLLPVMYEQSITNSHPNMAASELDAPQLVQEIYDAAIVYEESLLPVELSSFSASKIGSTVKLNWKTETEVNNYGFDILRLSQNDGSEWINIGFVEGNGNSNSPKYYSFEDNNLIAGKYSYRLKQIDTDGQFDYSKVIEINLDRPMKYELSQNYPNPFNPVTTIQFSIPQAGDIKLVVYNVLGEQVAELVNEYKEAGVYTINFNASELNSGLYIYKLTAGNFTNVKKLMLIK